MGFRVQDVISVYGQGSAFRGSAFRGLEFRGLAFRGSRKKMPPPRRQVLQLWSFVFRLSCIGSRVLGFRVSVLVFQVWVSVFVCRVSGLVFGVSDFTTREAARRKVGPRVRPCVARSGCGAWASEFRDEGFVFRFWACRFRVRFEVLRFKVSSFGLRESSFGFQISGFKFQVPSFKFHVQVSDLGLQVSCFGFQVGIRNSGFGFRGSHRRWRGRSSRRPAPLEMGARLPAVAFYGLGFRV